MPADESPNKKVPSRNPGLIAEILSSAKAAIDYLVSTEVLEENQGVMLGVMNLDKAEWLIDPTSVGAELSGIEKENSHRRCIENSFWLFVQYNRRGLLTSYYAQDEKVEHSAGAVLADCDLNFNLMISVAGLGLGIQDEFISLVVAVENDLMTLDVAREIAKRSGNNLFLNFQWVD